MPNLVKVLRKIPLFLFFIFGFFLPSQLGKHFWPNFAYVSGVRTDYFSPTIYLTDILLLILVFVTFWKRQRSNRFTTGSNQKSNLVDRSSLIVVLCCVLFALYYLLSPIKPLFLYRVWQYGKILLAAWIFVRSTRFERRWFAYGLVGATVYSLLLSCLQILNQGSLQGGWWLMGERLFSIGSPGIATISLSGQKILRAYASFSHPNSLGGFSLIVFVLCFIANFPLFSIPALLLILLSFSKTAIILLALVFLFLVLKKRQTCRFCKIAAVLFCAWIGMFALLFHGSAVSISERFAGWSFALMTIIQHPFGIGFGNYLFHGQPIHNIFLIMAMEFGPIGLISLIGLMIRLIRPMSLMRLISFKEFLLIFCIVCTGSVDHYWITLQQNMLLLGAVIGLVIARLRNPEIGY